MQIESKRMRHILSILVVFCGLAAVVFCTAYQYRHYSGKQIQLEDYHELEEGSYICKIDRIVEDNYQYDDIQGWVVVPGQPISRYNTSLVLYSDDGFAYAIPMKMMERDDVTESINDGVDYDMCGFGGRVRKSLLDGRTCYIGFLVDVSGNEYLIKTGMLYQAEKDS